MDMPEVGEKIGPLPIWAWVLVGGGVILVVAKLGHSGTSTAGTVLGGLGGGTPIINGVDPQQAAADREKVVADAITKQQGADKTIFDQAQAAAQSAYDAFKAQADQALADLRAADAQALAQSQAADNANLAAQGTGFLAQLAALKDQLAGAIAAGKAEADRLRAFYANEEAGIRSQDQSKLTSVTNDFMAKLAGANTTIAQLRAQIAAGGGGSGGTPPQTPPTIPQQVIKTAEEWATQARVIYGSSWHWGNDVRLAAGTVIDQGWALPVAYNGTHDLVQIQTNAGNESAAARVGRWVAEVMSGNPAADVNAVARAQIARLGADALDSAGAGNITMDQAGQILWPYGFDFAPVWNDIVALRKARGKI